LFKQLSLHKQLSLFTPLNNFRFNSKHFHCKQKTMRKTKTNAETIASNKANAARQTSQQCKNKQNNNAKNKESND